MNRCPTCGTTYAADAKFCTKDGARLVPAGASAPVGAPAGGPASTGTGGGAAPARTPVPSGANPMMVSGPRPTAASSSRGEPKPALGHMNLVGQTLDKRFKIERKLGEGGMSFVYLATDISTSNQFAIKVLSEALSQDENAMARLRREAALGMRLAHPNVCHIMQLGGTEDGLVYLVMPYVNGEILADRNNRLGRLPLPETVKFIKDMSAGLFVAHQLNIVHRDLKPENVMICRGKDGVEYAVVM